MSAAAAVNRLVRRKRETFRRPAWSAFVAINCVWKSQKPSYPPSPRTVCSPTSASCRPGFVELARIGDRKKKCPPCLCARTQSPNVIGQPNFTFTTTVCVRVERFKNRTKTAELKSASGPTISIRSVTCSEIHGRRISFSQTLGKSYVHVKPEWLGILFQCLPPPPLIPPCVCVLAN